MRKVPEKRRRMGRLESGIFNPILLCNLTEENPLMENLFG